MRRASPVRGGQEVPELCHLRLQLQAHVSHQEVVFLYLYVLSVCMCVCMLWCCCCVRFKHKSRICQLSSPLWGVWDVCVCARGLLRRRSECKSRNANAWDIPCKYKLGFVCRMLIGNESDGTHSLPQRHPRDNSNSNNQHQHPSHTRSTYLRAVPPAPATPVPPLQPGVRAPIVLLATPAVAVPIATSRKRDAAPHPPPGCWRSTAGTPVVGRTGTRGAAVPHHLLEPCATEVLVPAWRGFEVQGAKGRQTAEVRRSGEGVD